MVDLVLSRTRGKCTRWAVEYPLVASVHRGRYSCWHSSHRRPVYAESSQSSECSSYFLTDTRASTAQLTVFSCFYSIRLLVNEPLRFIQQTTYSHFLHRAHQTMFLCRRKMLGSNLISYRAASTLVIEVAAKILLTCMRPIHASGTGSQTAKSVGVVSAS